MSPNGRDLDYAMTQTEKLIEFVRKWMKHKPPKSKTVLKCIEEYRLTHYVHKIMAELLVRWDKAGADGTGDTETRRAEIDRQLGITKAWLDEVVAALTECEKLIPPVYDTLRGAEAARRACEEDLGKARENSVYKSEREYYKAKLLQCDRIIQDWHPGRPPQVSRRSSPPDRGGKKRQADSDSDDGDSEHALKRQRQDPGDSATAADPPPSQATTRSTNKRPALPFGLRLASWVGKAPALDPAPGPAPAPESASKIRFPSPASHTATLTRAATPTTRPTHSGASITTGTPELLKDLETLSVGPRDSRATVLYIGSSISTPTEIPVPTPSIPILSSKATTNPPPSTPETPNSTPSMLTRSSPAPPGPAPPASKTSSPPNTSPTHKTPPPTHPILPAAVTKAPDKFTKLSAEYRAFEEFCAANDQPEGAMVDMMLERADDLRERLASLELFDAMQEHLGVYELRKTQAAVEAQADEALAVLGRAETQQEMEAARDRLNDLRRQETGLAGQIADARQACDAEYAGLLQAVECLRTLSENLHLLQQWGDRAARGYLGTSTRNIQEV